MEFLLIVHYAAPSFSRGESNNMPGSTDKAGIAGCAGSIFLPSKTIPRCHYGAPSKQWFPEKKVIYITCHDHPSHRSRCFGKIQEIRRPYECRSGRGLREDIEMTPEQLRVTMNLRNTVCSDSHGLLCYCRAPLANFFFSYD